MTRIPIALLYALLALAVAPWADADMVRLRNGKSIEGTVQADSYTISTAERGDLVIPVSSITEMRFLDDGAVSVRLVDGSTLRGRLLTETIVLVEELFSNPLGVREIESITIAPRIEAASVPKGTPVELMLTEWLHSRSVQPGQTIRLCVAEDVQVGNALAIPRGAPAFGEVTEGRGAARGSQRGEVVIEPRVVLLPDGSRIPVVGAAGEFEGGLNAGAFFVAGVLGFLAKGEEVRVPPGTVLQTATRTEQTVGSPTEPGPEEQQAWEECRRFFQFSDLEVVPIEEVDLQETYAPFGTSLTASLPLAELARIEKGESLVRSLRNLLAYDTYIQTVTVAVDRGRKRARVPVRLFLVVLPSHDKRVDLELALVDGGEVLSEEAQRNLDAEEKKSKEVQMTLTAEPERFERALSSGTLRLTIKMSVRE